jgi:ankyrin repeat protein
MNAIFIKRQITGWIWFSALLAVGGALAQRFAFPGNPIGLDLAMRTALRLGTWGMGIIAVVLIIIYFLIPFVFDRIHAEQARKMVCSSLGGNVEAPKPSGAWVSQFYFVLGFALLLAGLATGYGMFKTANRSVFELVEAGMLPELQAKLQEDFSLTDKKNNAGETLLMVAVKRGDENMVKMLLSKGAAVDVQDHAQRTPLFFALNNHSLLRLLLLYGASVNVADGGGRTPLHAAIDQQNRKAVEVLIRENANINAYNSIGETPLIVAVKQKLDVVDMLLVNGADPNKADLFSERPLHHAARIGNEIAVKLLIAAGAETWATSLQGWTALHVAALNGEVGVAEMLIESGVDVDIPCKKKSRSPLLAAIFNGQQAMVALLLEHGADPNYRDRNGCVPLNQAVAAHQSEIVSMLMQAGADSDCADGSGLMAKELLTLEGHKDLPEH